MWRWTLKSLVSQPLTLFSSVAAAGFAFLLVLFFEALFVGESEKVVAYLRHSTADVWVMQSGVSNMHMASSYLPDVKVRKIRELPEVEAADAILYLNTVVRARRQQWFSFIVGLDPETTRAGPWAMAAGKALPGPGETVVPAVFADMTDLALGDTLRVADKDLEITGFSLETFSMANSVIFVTRRDLEDIMSSFDIVSYVLVWAAPGVEPAELVSVIERNIDKVSAVPARQFIENDRKMVLQMGVETIALMTLICGGLAMLLVGFTLYTRIARQRRELAIVKALGARNRQLYINVAVQALVITAASVIFALALAAVLMPMVEALVPQVSVKLAAPSVLRAAGGGLLVAVLASLVPARQVARVDPMAAFRS